VSAETPTRIITDSIRPDAAYQMGWVDAMDSLALGADQEAGLQAARLSRRLDEILDHAELIAPWPLEALTEAEAVPVPFDWEQAA
jgi:hypothetical protein